MYRPVIWKSPASLRILPASYSTFRHNLRSPRLASDHRLRYYSTPIQSPDNRQGQTQQPIEDAVKTSHTPAQLYSETPTAQSSTNSSERAGAGVSHSEQLDEVKARVKEWSHDALKGMRQRSDEFTARVARTFAQLGSELNRVTGYGEIEVLKRKVVEQEARIYNAREAARQAKDAYDTAVLQRAKSQREVNDLLQRKSLWTDDDVSRFTTLVREDHSREHDEGRAKAAAATAEDAVEREFSELMRVILNRYHEEQAWSDKIRSASTYGSLAALALNMAVFVLAIVLVEPWKRRRLAQTFERKVEEMSAQTQGAFEASTGELRARMDEQAAVVRATLEMVHSATQVSAAEMASMEREEVYGEVTSATEGAKERERVPAAKRRGEQELLFAVTASAAIAGLVGWVARSWYG